MITAGHLTRFVAPSLAAFWLGSSAAGQCPLPLPGVDLQVGGYVCAVFGDLALTGNGLKFFAGRAALYERNQGGPGAWGQVAALVPTDGHVGDNFGAAVAVHGERLVIGAHYHDYAANGPGAVYVFERDAGGPGQWGQVAKLTPTTANPDDAQFGFSVATHENTILVGAPYLMTGGGGGGAFVFERDPQSATWTQTAELLPPSPVSGEGFGWSVDLEGDTAVVGEPADGSVGGVGGVGSVFVHGRDQGGPDGWGLVKQLQASDPEPDARFGTSLDLAADGLLVGAPQHGHGGLTDSGGAYVFERDLGGPDNWGERQELQPAGPLAGEELGWRVGFDGQFALLRNIWSNAVYVFERGVGTPSAWSLAAVPSLQAIDVRIDAGTAVLAYFPATVIELTSTQPFSAYCTPGTSSSGCLAAISACGASSASAPSGFQLQAAGVEGSTPGLFFFGTGGRQAKPWGNGTSLQCVVPPVKRTGVLPGSGTSGACDGAFSLDLNATWCPTCPQSHRNPGAGAVVQAQLWYRDPQNTSSQKTAFSGALEFAVGP